MFTELMEAVKSEVVALLLRIEVQAGDRGGDGSLEPKAQRALDSGGSNARQPEVGEGLTTTGGSTSSTGGLAVRSRATSSLTYGTAAAPTALQEAKAEAGLAEAQAPVVQQRRVEQTVGRNEPCPCGSGKKYKNCHGRA